MTKFEDAASVVIEISPIEYSNWYEASFNEAPVELITDCADNCDKDIPQRQIRENSSFIWG